MAAEELAKEGIQPDVVIVDPPRKGCSPELIGVITDKFSPNRVVYVSCDPATLARDVSLLKEKGFSLQNAQAFDLFPRCAHVESVVLLVRKDSHA
jgi:23S rRNA (uracil1939-C5)-methyltransferase